MITNTVTRLLLAVAALAVVASAALHGANAALMSYFAKQLGVHPTKFGKELVGRVKNARAQGQRATPVLRAAATGDSKAYAAMYMYTQTDCSDDPVMAMAMHADSCFTLTIGPSSASFYISCAKGDGLVISVYEGKDCKDKNFVTEISLFAEATCTDSLGDDDGDIDIAMGFSMECTNNIREEFVNGPTVAFYLGTSCQGNWLQAVMFPEADCLEVADSSSYRSVCSADALDVTLYNSTMCTGTEDADHFPVGVCQSDDDGDDDGGDDYLAPAAVGTNSTDDEIIDHNDDGDDGDDGAIFPFIGSSYAACKFDDVPGDSAASLPMMANWALLLVSAILGLQLAAF